MASWIEKFVGPARPDAGRPGQRGEEDRGGVGSRRYVATATPWPDSAAEIIEACASRLRGMEAS